HGHFHMQNMVVFRIRQITSACGAESAAGSCAVIATSSKIGFCLFDHFTVDASFTRNASGPYLENGCTAGAGAANTMSVGLSGGKEEEYDWDIAHQSIDASTLADGQYWLEAEVNTPSSPVIVESDATNNISRVKLQLSGNSVTAL